MVVAVGIASVVLLIVVAAVGRATVAVVGHVAVAVAVVTASVPFAAEWAIFWTDGDVRMEQTHVIFTTSRTSWYGLTELRVMDISTFMANSL